MGKVGRGALWLLFPPAGAISSYRAGRRRDVDRIVEAIRQGNGNGNGHHVPSSSETGNHRAAAVVLAVIVGGYWLLHALAAVGGAAVAILGGTFLLCGLIAGGVWLADRRRRA
jgi:hypothetical protein